MRVSVALAMAERRSGVSGSVAGTAMNYLLRCSVQGELLDPFATSAHLGRPETTDDCVRSHVTEARHGWGSRRSAHFATPRPGSLMREHLDEAGTTRILCIVYLLVKYMENGAG